MTLTTLRVFEHQTVRVGERLEALGGGTGALSDADFDALVRFNDAKGGRFFSVGHRRIKLSHYVGYVQVGTLGLEILPKADQRAARPGDEGRWRQALLRMLEVASGVRLESPSAAAQSAARSSLLELVALRLVEVTTRLLHEGLAKGYRDDDANGAIFRGRLLVTQNIRENLARADRFYVRFQTYDRDIPVNRILAAAFDALFALPLGTSLAVRAAACRAAFPDVRPARLTPGLFERLPMTRATARYGEALTLARMILEQRAPELRPGHAPVLAILFDMNILWERYVAALFRRAAGPNLRVSTQEGRSFWEPDALPRRAVRPDLVVRSVAPERIALVADTKWKVPEGGAPSIDDLKQMFVYNELFGAPLAVLIYPSAGGAFAEQRGCFASRAHQCGAFHLGLFKAGEWSVSGAKDEIERLLRQGTQQNVVGSDGVIDPVA